ncbi:MAG: PLP-dependent aminotransferase family protein, partial [Planctomycetales bacterium]|nr:PLP-dependent aminotransferase family protein [Planctomycetales bacterium]
YFVFLGTLRGVDARVIGVRADADGMCLDALQEALEAIVAAGQAPRLKAIYTVTDFDNPAGSTLSLPRRQQLLEITRRWRSEHGPLLILSDNAYQHLRFEGEAQPPLTALADDAADFVVELGTFSKSFSPGIRVGWGVVPENMVGPLLEIKSNMDFGSPHFSQVLLWEALVTGELEAHLPEIKAGYRAKRDAMLAALDRELEGFPGVHWRQPQGGLYVWLTLPEQIDASEQGLLWRCATESGVLYVPGHYCYPGEGEPVQRNTMRLSYGVQSCEGIAQGISRLASAIREAAETCSLPV